MDRNPQHITFSNGPCYISCVLVLLTRVVPIKNKNEDTQLSLAVPMTGTVYPIILKSEHAQLHYENQNGKLFFGDSINWLKNMEACSVDMIFADPPYNIKRAEWDNFESMAHYVEWSKSWIKESARILKPSGTLYVCGYSEILAHLVVASASLFRGCRWLVWHYKNKANLGNDWGRSHESIVHFRKSDKTRINVDSVRIPYGAHTLKYPSHPQAETSQYANGNTKNDHQWAPHPDGAKPKDVFDIPTTCNGMGEKTKHPTQKPEELLRKLVLASSNAGDMVLDPFSGSGTTLVVCEQLNRFWVGCDNNLTYNEYAIKRLEHVIKRPVEEWIRFDQETAKRRESIR
jgi:site-specific DNA-methyltransferase (adenine-specific)